MCRVCIFADSKEFERGQNRGKVNGRRRCSRGMESVVGKMPRGMLVKEDGRLTYFFLFTSRPFVSLFTHPRFPLSLYVTQAQQALDFLLRIILSLKSRGDQFQNLSGERSSPLALGNREEILIIMGIMYPRTMYHLIGYILNVVIIIL